MLNDYELEVWPPLETICASDLKCSNELQPNGLTSSNGPSCWDDCF